MTKRSPAAEAVISEIEERGAQRAAAEAAEAERKAREHLEFQKRRAAAEKAANAAREAAELEAYQRAIADVAATLAPVLAYIAAAEPGELDRDLHFKADALEQLRQVFARGREHGVAHRLHFESRPIRPRRDASQPIVGGLILLNKARVQHVSVDGTTFILGPWANFLPADVIDLRDVEAHVAAGRLELLPPGSVIPPEPPPADGINPWQRGK